MRATRVLNGRISVADNVPLPALGPGQVLVSVRSCGICGSDLSLVKNSARFVDVAREGGYGLVEFDPALPVTPGHEFSGVVLETGPGTQGFTRGDMVTGIGVVTDQETGRMSIIGYSNRYPGALGEQVVVDADWLRHVPDGMDHDTAALAEPLHVGETHVQQSGWDGQPAVVIGAGTIGLGVVIALRARGARSITVVEPSSRRRAVAEALGAHRVEVPGAEAPAALAEAAEPLHVFECSGRLGALEELIRTVPFGSHLQVAASGFAPETFVPVIAQWRQLVVNFGSGPVDDPYGITLRRLADGVIDPELLITGRWSLDQVAEGFEALANPEDHVKILIRPRD